MIASYTVSAMSLPFPLPHAAAAPHVLSTQSFWGPLSLIFRPIRELRVAAFHQ